ncbi:MAG: cytochrome P450 [Mycobacterium sp.]
MSRATQPVGRPTGGDRAIAPLTGDPAKRLSWAAMTRGALVTRLNHRRGWYRQIAGFDIAYFHCGTRRFVSLAHPDHIDHVLHEGRLNYQKSVEYETLRAVLGLGLLTDEGETWHWHRDVINPGLAKRRLNGLVESMVGPITDLAADIDESVDGATEIDMTGAMLKLALDVTGKVVFTDKFGKITEAMLAMVTTNLRFGDPATRVLLLAAIPKRLLRVVIRTGLSAVPLPWPYRAMQATVRSIDRAVWDLVRHRQAHPTASEDLLNYLLCAEDEGGARLSDQRVHDESLTFIAAGYETTGNGLQWLWYLLALHPQARERMLAEVDDVLGGRVPAAEDLPKLRWTTACFMETLRYYSPSWAMWRLAVKPDNIGGHPIRPGTTILLAAHAVHHDPRWWHDPEEFDPARFLSAAAKDRPRGAYVPFGSGKRICIGQNLAVMEAVLTIAVLSQRFVFDIKPGHPVEPEAAMSLRPRYGLRMIVRSR